MTGDSFNIGNSGYVFRPTGNPEADAKNYADANGISLDEAKEQLRARYGEPWMFGNNQVQWRGDMGTPIPMIVSMGGRQPFSLAGLQPEQLAAYVSNFASANNMSEKDAARMLGLPDRDANKPSSASTTQSSVATASTASTSTVSSTSTSSPSGDFDNLSRSRKKELASWRSDFYDAYKKEYKSKYPDKKERALRLRMDSYEYLKTKWAETYPNESFPLKDDEPVAVYDELNSGKTVMEYDKKELKKLVTQAKEWRAEFEDAHKGEYKLKYKDKSERSLQMTKAAGDYVLEKWNETHPGEMCPVDILYFISRD